MPAGAYVALDYCCTIVIDLHLHHSIVPTVPTALCQQYLCAHPAWITAAWIIDNATENIADWNDANAWIDANA